MINTTILSLNIISLFSISPLYTLYNTHQGQLRSSFFNSHFSRSFSSIIYSNTNMHKTNINRNVFSHVINSAIYLVNNDDLSGNDCIFLFKDGSLFGKGTIIHDQVVQPDQYIGYKLDERNLRPYFRNNACGDIKITDCIFNGCHAQTFNGGSIHIEQDASVVIHGTIFNNSYTGERFGGAGVICQKITNENDGNFDTIPMRQLDVQYCCFQDCYGTGEDNNYGLKKLYGVALFMAANNTVLYYASTVDCPGFNEGRKQTAGAQFDMNAANVTSKYVNSTGANSQYCGGIEYRKAKEGFFKFQTISNMKCMFSIAYTDIEQSKLDLSYSNIFNIELIAEDRKDALYPGLIHVRNTKVIDNYLFEINHFSFLNNDITGNSRIVSRGANYNALQPIKIIINNCTYDCGNDYQMIN